MSKITENWCDFVLTEGLMPSLLVRNLHANQFHNADLCAYIANILNSRGNSDNTESHILLNNETIKCSFKADPELSNWLAGMNGILEIIKNYANKDKMFANIVDEACLSFIKACSLVAEDRKQLYTSETIKPEPLSLFPTFSDIKQTFKEYLEKNQYSPNTINSYISGINKVGKLANIQRNLWEINDAAEMRHLIAHWENNTNHLYDDYKEQDALSRKTLSNAVKRYAEFLNFQSLGK